MVLISPQKPQKLFLFLRYLSFCFDFLAMYKNTLIRKKVNFKIYDVTNWLANNYNTHIDQYLKK